MMEIELRLRFTREARCSLHPGVQMGTGEFNAGGNAGGNPAMD